MSEKEWEHFVNKSSLRDKHTNIRGNSLFYKVVETLRRIVTIELLIGVIAAFSYYMLFGAADLEKTLLSWVIGLTLASTMLTLMIGRYKRITKLE